MKGAVEQKFNQWTTTNKTNWQYCPMDKLISQKEEYDKWVTWKKLESAIINKYDSFDGKPYDGIDFNRKAD